MTTLEVVLFLLVIVESVQVSAMLWNIVKMRKQVDRIVSDPEFMGKVLSSMLFGFMERVKKNPEDADKLFGFIAVAGQAAFDGVMQMMNDPKNPTGSSLSSLPLDFLPKKIRGLVGLADHPLVRKYLERYTGGKTASAPTDPAAPAAPGEW